MQHDKAFPCVIALSILLCVANDAQAKRLRIASTTSTQNSGLYDFILPVFTAETGIEVDVIALGTGQAIRIAQNGDADVLLVHHRPSEDRFMAQGYGQARFDVMYNDFVLIGSDKLKLDDKTDINSALTQIAQNELPFISRGDDSGTHKKELELWDSIELIPSGHWYQEIGAGMGAALNMAVVIDGFTLSDRGTWLSFGNKGDLTIKVAGDERLRNPYGLIVLNAARFPHINVNDAQRFADWITSARGQALIGQFRVDNQQLFCPNVSDNDALKALCPANQPVLDTE